MKDPIWITHPSIPGKVGGPVSRASLAMVWEPRGWVETDRPVKEPDVDLTDDRAVEALDGDGNLLSGNEEASEGDEDSDDSDPGVNTDNKER